MARFALLRFQRISRLVGENLSMHRVREIRRCVFMTFGANFGANVMTFLSRLIIGLR